MGYHVLKVKITGCLPCLIIACAHVLCDIDQFYCSSSITDFITINTKYRPFQINQALLFIIHSFCSPRIPLKFSHDNNCNNKI